MSIKAIRECGLDPENKVTVPFQQIDGETVGVFTVEFSVTTDCEPGDYSASFYVIDKEDNTSNQIEIVYTIVESA